MKEFLQDFISSGGDLRLIRAIIIIIVAFILTLIIRRLMTPSKVNKLSGDNKRAKTYIQLINNLVTSLIAIFAVLLILSIYGVDVKAYAAGLGIVGIIVGFALQDFLGDIVKGIELMVDGAFDVDDLIVVNGQECLVKNFDLRKTTLFSITTGNDIELYNSKIDSVEHMCDYVDVPVLIGWEVPYSEGCRRIREVIPALERLQGAFFVEYIEPRRTTDASIEYRIRIHGDMTKKYIILRKANDIILKHFEENEYTVGCENRYVIK